MVHISLVLAYALSVWACSDIEPVESALPVSAEASAVAEEPAPSLVELAPRVFQGVEDIGLVRPVAVLHDPTSDVYLISNGGRDGYPGFITSMLPEGSVETLRWIDGAADGVTLRTPAGMALIQTRLVVADGAHLRIFDRQTGVQRGTIHIDGAVALKDVAVGSRGAIYVTDAGAVTDHDAAFGAVYRVSRRGKVSVVAKSSVLGRPTGLVMTGTTAWIAAVEPEAFFAISRRGSLIHGASLPTEGGFSGLTWADGRVFFSSVARGTIYAGSLEGPFVPIIEGVTAPGDVGWDQARRRLLIPCSTSDSLEIHDLPIMPQG